MKWCTKPQTALISTRNDTVEWNTTVTSTSVYHELRKGNTLNLDLYDVAENANLYIAMPQVRGFQRREFTRAKLQHTGNWRQSPDRIFLRCQVEIYFERGVGQHRGCTVSRVSDKVNSGIHLLIYACLILYTQKSSCDGVCDRFGHHRVHSISCRLGDRRSKRGPSVDVWRDIGYREEEVVLLVPVRDNCRWRTSLLHSFPGFTECLTAAID